MNQKKLIVITGPSGAGLSDAVAALFRKRSDLATVVPVTARKKKEEERDGIGFYFFDLDGWNELKNTGDLLETTELAGNDYGTSRKLVEQQLSHGNHVLLSVEPERAAQIKRNMPEAVCVFLMPQDPEQLRLRYRETVRNSYELTARLALAEKQKTTSGFCDFQIDSGDFDAALEELNRLIDGL